MKARVVNGEPREEPRFVDHVLHCTNQLCETWWNRDLLAVANQVTQAKHIFEHGVNDPRFLAGRRAQNGPVAEEEDQQQQQPAEGLRSGTSGSGCSVGTALLAPPPLRSLASTSMTGFPLENAASAANSTHAASATSMLPTRLLAFCQNPPLFLFSCSFGKRVACAMVAGVRKVVRRVRRAFKAIKEAGNCLSSDISSLFVGHDVDHELARAEGCTPAAAAVEVVRSVSVVAQNEPVAVVTEVEPVAALTTYPSSTTIVPMCTVVAPIPAAIIATIAATPVLPTFILSTTSLLRLLPALEIHQELVPPSARRSGLAPISPNQAFIVTAADQVIRESNMAEGPAAEGCEHISVLYGPYAQHAFLDLSHVDGVTSAAEWKAVADYLDIEAMKCHFVFVAALAHAGAVGQALAAPISTS
ncbi:hypothetical protein BC828DRAFT_402842 [Blastocladiella britannica]|nr:hypothetical protein BC828DRAFT_402842 [Blastocladiella britannica]